MSNLTNHLPNDLLDRLETKSKEIQIPVQKIVENAINIYIEQLERIEYMQSYQLASQDQNTIEIAEEGMRDYMNQIAESDGNNY